MEFGALPRLLVARTGGGGSHIYFAAPAIPIPTSHGKLGAGIDIQSTGAYAVAPPSLHVSGRRYRWEGRGPWGVQSLPSLPEGWLAKLTSFKKSGSAATSAESGAISKGARNTTLTSIAGQLHRTGLSNSALLAALRAENGSRCDPPLEESEVQQ